MAKAIPLVDVVTLSQKQCSYPIQAELKYATEDNLVGQPLPGYDPHITNFCPLAPKAAEALCKAQNDFNQAGFGIIAFDAYRPLRTVEFFTKWVKTPPPSKGSEEEKSNLIELVRKQIHYPHLKKAELIEKGYLSPNISKHCYGRSIDLMLITLADNKLINLGAIFDYFDPVSHSDATLEMIGEEAFNNRQYLFNVMDSHGFSPLTTEFWHFDYQTCELEEPLDIPIDKASKAQLTATT